MSVRWKLMLSCQMHTAFLCIRSLFKNRKNMIWVGLLLESACLSCTSSFQRAAVPQNPSHPSVFCLFLFLPFFFFFKFSLNKRHSSCKFLTNDHSPYWSCFFLLNLFFFKLYRPNCINIYPFLIVIKRVFSCTHLQMFPLIIDFTVFNTLPKSDIQLSAFSKSFT